MKLYLAIFCCFLGICSSAQQTEINPDHALLEQRMESFFQGINSKDTGLLRSMIMPDTEYFVSISLPDTSVILRNSHDHWIKEIGSSEAELMEDYWNPVISIHRGIASVQTEYAFYINGELSHCGVNTFSWIKYKGQWMITNTVFSYQKDCEAFIKP